MKEGKTKRSERIIILGAGLVGSLMSIYLSKKGYRVSVYEKRNDLRENEGGEGRSINLALSTRGWRALEEVGVTEEIRNFAISMKGRMMHDAKGKLTFQPYGKEGEAIYSISRGLLNEVLTSASESLGTAFHFNQKCIEVNLNNNEVVLEDMLTGQVKTERASLIVGADGAFSTLRAAIQKGDNFSYEQHFIEHGYKELTIPATPQNRFALDEHALHIWPRKQYMLIALPNPDKTFTCTLFYPFEGENSFQYLNNTEKVLNFFQNTFPDVIPLIPDLLNNFFKNPTASLVTIKCFPWSSNGGAVLIGDASHAILPFFGQGMNSGFEDCRIFNELTDKHNGNWPLVVNEFEQTRKPDTDAIAELALQNFVEMRDLVADPQFLLRKQIESKLHQLFPDQWVPLYSMVTFSNMPYSTAKAMGAIQDRIMDEVMALPGIENNWESIDYDAIINKFAKATHSYPSEIKK